MTIDDLLTDVKARVDVGDMSDQQIVDLINFIEGRIYTEVLMISESDFTPFVYPTDAANVLIVDNAHTSLYIFYLESEIHYVMGDYHRANAATMRYNEAMEAYKRHIAFVYKPANFQEAASTIYYIRSITKDIGDITYAQSSGVALDLSFDIPEGYMVTRAICAITTVFNSATSDTIILGTATDDDKFIAAGVVDATTVGSYASEPDYVTAADTAVYAKNTQVGAAASTGSATFYLVYEYVQ